MSDAAASHEMTRRTRIWIVVTILSIFGPYLAAGARTEQLVIYGSAGAIVLIQRTRLVQQLRPALPLVVLLGTYAALVLATGLVVENHTKWESGSLVAGTDNVLLPLAILVVVTYWATLCDAAVVLRTAAWTVAIAMVCNAVIAIVTNYAGSITPPLLGRFWTSGGAEVVVAELSAANGRFSGVFNQPVEAGVAYSLALLCVLYLMRGDRDRRLLLLGMLALVIVGGLLTFSKVFLIGGLFIGLLFALGDRANRWWSVTVSFASVVLFSTLSFFGLAGSWGASYFIGWYRDSIERGDSLVYTLSAGRFGTHVGTGTLPTMPGGGTDSGGDPSVATMPTEGAGVVIREILDHHPLLGVGARGLQVSYDTTWIEALIVGGVLGVLLIVAIHAYLVVRWVRLRPLMDRSAWTFAGAVICLVLGSSFGMPSLTGNRESALLWIFLGTLLVGYAMTTAAQRSGTDDSNAATAPPSGPGAEPVATPAHYSRPKAADLE
jgi:hypothetical protein